MPSPDCRFAQRIDAVELPVEQTAIAIAERAKLAGNCVADEALERPLNLSGRGRGEIAGNDCRLRIVVSLSA